MKYNNEGEFTHFSNLSTDDIVFFIKMNIPMMIYAADKHNRIQSLIAFFRNSKDQSRGDTKTCKYIINYKPDYSTEKRMVVSDLEILRMISKMTDKSNNEIYITVKTKWINDYDILLPVIGKISHKVLAQFYRIDVTKEYILIQGKDIGKYPQKVYYFFNDYSLLKFDENGFNTIIDRSKSKFTTPVILNSIKFK